MFYPLNIIVFLLACCSIARAQHVQHWSENEGLSNRFVNHAIRTSDGYLWVATNNGLNRFDGYEFVKVDQQNNPQLTSSYITYLLEAPKGILWVATDNGISLISLKTNKVISVFKHQAKKASTISSPYVVQLHHAPDNSVWVICEDGILNKYQFNGTFKRFTNTTSLNKSFGKRVKITNYKGYLWLKTQNSGVFKINPKSGAIVKRYLINEASYNEAQIVQLPKLGLVCMMQSGVYQFDDVLDEFVPRNMGNLTEVYRIIDDNNGNYWVTTFDRTKLFYVKNGKAKEVTSSLFHTYQNVSIGLIVKGNTNEYWIASNNGLFKMIAEPSLFNGILTKEASNNSAYVPSFRGIMQDETGTIYAGGYGGLFKIDAQKNTSCVLDNKKLYSPNVILDIDEKWCWLVSEGRGLNLFNKQTHQLKPIKKDQHKYNYLISAAVNKSGSILLGGYDELVWYIPGKNKFEEQKLVVNGVDVQRPFVRYIYKSSKNEMWVCTNNGLFVLNEQNKVVKHYSVSSVSPYQLASNQINYVFEDSKKQMYVATDGGGVSFLTADGRVYKTLTMANGLAGNRIASVIKDSSNRLWVATFSGISVVDEHQNVTSYYKENGITDNEFNSTSALYAKDGSILFGGINGINWCNIQTDYLPKITYDNKIVISGLELVDANTSVNYIKEAAQIAQGVVLNHSASYLGVSFFNTDFTYPEKNKFLYKLEGLSNDWIPIGEKNFLRFASLIPGKYVLHIKGMSPKSDAAAIATLSIVVHEVFYKTFWFLVVSIVAVLSIVLGLVYMRIKRIEEIASFRNQISRNLHDDVGGALTQVAMQAEILELEVNETHKLAINEIIQTARIAISNMRDLVWSNDKQYHHIGNLFDKITELVDRFNEIAPVQIKLQLQDNSTAVELTAMQRQEVFFIIKEAIHNITKHGNGPEAWLTIFTVKNTLVFEICNTSKAATHKKINTGSGLNNMRLRANRIKANLQITTGTNYCVTLAVSAQKHKLIPKFLYD